MSSARITMATIFLHTRCIATHRISHLGSAIPIRTVSENRKFLSLVTFHSISRCSTQATRIAPHKTMADKQKSASRAEWQQYRNTQSAMLQERQKELNSETSRGNELRSVRRIPVAMHRSFITAADTRWLCRELISSLRRCRRRRRSVSAAGCCCCCC